MFCQVEPLQVIAVHDVSSTYHVPLLLENQGFIGQLTSLFRLSSYPISPSLATRGQSMWTSWKSLTTSQDRFLSSEAVTIALVGKYTNLHDSYLSVIKSLEHSAMACQRKLNLLWVDASNLESATLSAHPESYHKAWHELCTADGVLVPGGFGHRGTEGMVAAANWARTKPKPYLGICLGMQIAVVEYARNVCGLAAANSVELDANTEHAVVVFMPEIDPKTMGGNMRLGLRPTLFQSDSDWSRLRKLYSGVDSVNERHRHRYEVNPSYIEKLEGAGLNFIGRDDKGERMEIVELKDHPFFVGVQYHPEYLSRVLKPSPPYLGFVAASAGLLDEVMAEMGRMNDGVNGDANGHVNGSLVNGVRKISLGNGGGF
jgi:CTP synthase